MTVRDRLVSGRAGRGLKEQTFSRNLNLFLVGSVPQLSCASVSGWLITMDPARLDARTVTFVHNISVSGSPHSMIPGGADRLQH